MVPVVIPPLARLILGEEPEFIQHLGGAAALVGAVLVAAG